MLVLTETMRLMFKSDTGPCQQAILPVRSCSVTCPSACRCYRFYIAMAFTFSCTFPDLTDTRQAIRLRPRPMRPFTWVSPSRITMITFARLRTGRADGSLLLPCLPLAGYWSPLRQSPSSSQFWAAVPWACRRWPGPRYRRITGSYLYSMAIRTLSAHDLCCAAVPARGFRSLRGGEPMKNIIYTAIFVF